MSHVIPRQTKSVPPVVARGEGRYLHIADVRADPCKRPLSAQCVERGNALLMIVALGEASSCQRLVNHWERSRLHRQESFHAETRRNRLNSFVNSVA